MKIWLIGCGSIGRTIAIAMDRTEAIGSIFLFDRSEEAARSLATRLDKAVHVTSIEVLIKNSELVVEAARPFRRGFLVRFPGVLDRTQAETLHGRYLLRPRSELEDLVDGEDL